VGSAYPLRDRSILVVEDEPLIALELHAALSRAGASVLAGTSLDEAMRIISYADIAAAILDVSLGAHDCSPACAALARRRIPFIFYSGYCSAPVLEQWADAPKISKPARRECVISLLSTLTNTQLLTGGRHEGHRWH
jgi:CheY-like chemotaxis protein